MDVREVSIFEEMSIKFSLNWKFDIDDGFKHIIKQFWSKTALRPNILINLLYIIKQP